MNKEEGKKFAAEALVLIDVKIGRQSRVLEKMAEEQLRTWLPVSDHNEVEVTILMS